VDGWAGRFAPSPTGPLHVGSLIAAVASRADARARDGRWLLRIDDIDPPREASGARESIPRTLERHAMPADGPIRYQSARLDRYHEALGALAADGLLYRCRCTRRMLVGHERYPGTCRGERADPDDVESLRPSAVPWARPGDALRLRLSGRLCVDDAVQGAMDVDLASGPGDIVVRRRDGLIAYPLASAVDDAEVAHVVRGADLLAATAAQQAVLERLGLDVPGWAHVPVAIEADGRKLGKSTDAPPVDEGRPLETLLAVWRFLGQPTLTVGSSDDFWRVAPDAWSLGAVPHLRAQALPEGVV